MGLSNGLAVLMVLSLVFAHVGLVYCRYERWRRETATKVQDALADDDLSVFEKTLLLRLFYVSLRWWFLPATLVASSVLVPRLCFFQTEDRYDELSLKTLPLLLQCLKLQVVKYPLIALFAGTPLVVWILLMGALAFLLPGARRIRREGLLRVLGSGLALLPE